MTSKYNRTLLKTLATLNTVTLLLALFANYYLNTGVIDGNNVGTISARYEALTTPASYTFSIWGLIYLMLISYVGFQWYTIARDRVVDHIIDAGLWFTISNLANAAWMYVWLNEWLGISVAVMLLLLTSLLMLMVKLRLEIWDAPLAIILFVWWPIVVYLGWIVLASISNISAYLVSLDWNGDPLSEVSWAYIMLVMAVVVYVQMIRHRNLREAALVGIWGFAGIAVKQWNNETSVAVTAIIGAVILMITAGYHGYKNQETSPAVKLKKGEWF